MSRFAKRQRVFFVEEPVYDPATPGARLKANVCPSTGVNVITPVLPESMRDNATAAGTAEMLNRFFERNGVGEAIFWLYTPMALDALPKSIPPIAVVYDCMDELSLFRGAPEHLRGKEEELLSRADLVFTGGVSLFEAKRERHRNVHPFPSGVDVPHFAQARGFTEEFGEHQSIARPRLGYAGVIDERIDLDLIKGISKERPEWQIVMIGPVVKIDPAGLPQAENIHWLGMKDYGDLPKYFSGWDVALMPFAINDATRFISPTKTPEYLSAGVPVVSSPIRDVVHPYADLGLVRIANTVEEFVTAAEQSMAFGMSLKWRERADQFLQTLSWDAVWCSMNRLIGEITQTRFMKRVGEEQEAARV
jgi:UDP-galactopyranose mutase